MKPKYQPLAKKVTKGPPPKKQAKEQSTVIEQFAMENIQLDPAQEAIISLIQEYLLSYNLLNTLDMLQRQLLSGQIGNDNVRSDGDLLNHFDKGEQEMFFIMWNRYLPYNLRMKDDEAKKLEFYIQIYFLIQDVDWKEECQIRMLRIFFPSSNNTQRQRDRNYQKQLNFTLLCFSICLETTRPLNLLKLFQRQWILELKAKLVKLIIELLSKEQPFVLEQMYNNFTEDQPKKQVNLSLSNQNYTTQMEIKKMQKLEVTTFYPLISLNSKYILGMNNGDPNLLCE